MTLGYDIWFLKCFFNVVYMVGKAAHRFEDERSAATMQLIEQMPVIKAVVSKGNVKGVTASRFPRHAVAAVCIRLLPAGFLVCRL
jgi:hypothetical protein